jgi:hypothetical protein
MQFRKPVTESLITSRLENSRDLTLFIYSKTKWFKLQIFHQWFRSPFNSHLHRNPEPNDSNWSDSIVYSCHFDWRYFINHFYHISVIQWVEKPNSTKVVRSGGFWVKRRSCLDGILGLPRAQWSLNHVTLKIFICIWYALGISSLLCGSVIGSPRKTCFFL